MAVAASTGELIVFTDAGTDLPADSIERLVETFADAGVGAVSSEDRFVSSEGKVVGEYYHPGWLWSATVKDINGDGWDEILLGGVNNAYGAQPGATHSVTMVVLDSRDMAGQGPAPTEDERHFQGLSEGHEKAVVLFPEFGQVPNGNPALFCLARGIRAHNGAIEVSVIKNNGTDPEFLEAT